MQEHSIETFVNHLLSSDFMTRNQSLKGFVNSKRWQCFNVTITEDDVREDVETFTLTLEKPFNGSLPKILIRPAMVTVTILDNDGEDM